MSQFFNFQDGGHPPAWIVKFNFSNSCALHSRVGKIMTLKNIKNHIFWFKS